MTWIKQIYTDKKGGQNFVRLFFVSFCSSFAGGARRAEEEGKRKYNRMMYIRVMINIPDIQQKINSDFNSQANDVFELFKTLAAGGRHLNDPRIFRCILFLADKNFEKLKVLIDSAKTDTRDIIMWAEYMPSGPGDQTKRVRDFSKTFEESEKDVKE